MPNIVKTDKNNIDLDLIKKAVLTLKQGKTIIFPTQSLYGIGANAFNPNAVKKIFQIKKRLLSTPILILIKNKKALDKLVLEIPDIAEKLMENFWPGRLTIVFKAAKTVNRIIAPNKKIGIRLPAHPIAAAIANSAEFPITATSANISGAPAISEIKNTDKNFIENFDLIIDAGKLKGGKGSTVIDVTDKKNGIKILREGSIPADQIIQFEHNAANR
ncbi:MAG: threonylcarbamoyl-AMP synthase [Deltaproteobacteria bacterium]|nr:threonylcarbamoyl-AMP synthase [Deltaproteobacteria bacterium]